MSGPYTHADHMRRCIDDQGEVYCRPTGSKGAGEGAGKNSQLVARG